MFSPIGFLHSAFSEKFGVPRQSGMLTSARGVLKLNPDMDYRTALGRLEEFSHIWIVFLFHKNEGKAWRPIIDPPTNEKVLGVGVFASRSPDRPNPIGLSAVKLDRIDYEATGGIEIHVSGVDILDGTPVLDIKPYLPLADRINDANDGWTDAQDPKYEVSFSPEAQKQFVSIQDANLRSLIIQMLERDPRPPSQRRAAPMKSRDSLGKAFAFRVGRLDVRWKITEDGPRVTEIQ